MKIKKIELENHIVFGNHTITFDGLNAPKIVFLVGNNGSGKSLLLNLIFDIFNENDSPTRFFQENGSIKVHVNLSDSEKSELHFSTDEAIYSIIKTRDTYVKKLSNIKGEEPYNGIFESILRKVNVWPSGTIEDFTNIGGTANPELDHSFTMCKRPVNTNEVSNEVYRLIIDIEKQDREEKLRLFEAGSNISNFKPKLSRFTDAYNKMFSGSKEYLKIDADSNIYFKDLKIKQEIKFSELSTGEKQIFYKVPYILRNLGKMEGAIILIDEPELGLHPTWQIKLKEFLLEIFNSIGVQLIIATHSPYLFNDLDDTSEVCVNVDRTKLMSEKISLTFPSFPNITYKNPSVALVTYLAYGIPTELLHIELYTLLQIRENKEDITNMENWLKNSTFGNITNTRSFERTKSFKGKPIGNLETETLPTYIRHKIDHGDEVGRVYTTEDLEDSIKIMIKLLMNP